MKHHGGLQRGIKIAAFTLLCIPVGLVTSGAGFHFNFPTPGILVFWLFPVTEQNAWGPDVLRTFAAALVNGISCYLVVRGLIVAVRWLRREKHNEPSESPTKK